ncbi:MAG: DUF488 family protein [Nitrososphaerales archaeon]|nr:DUF488 family protein [Nitrososphaerales archaeon]
MIQTAKSVYDKPGPDDGERILVMRTWPRGISKGKVDKWLKELGTDMDLIHEWKQGKVTWEEFSSRYVKSLKGKEEVLMELASESKKGTVTLLCTDKDETRCHRSLLRKEIERYL